MIALGPEFITPPGGYEKQDCERRAIKHWVLRNAGQFAGRSCTLLGDDLYACQPVCELFLETGFDFILVCKPDSHLVLSEQVEFLANNGLVEQISTRKWTGRFWKVYQVPLRRGEDALQVNWCEISVTPERHQQTAVLQHLHHQYPFGPRKCDPDSRRWPGEVEKRERDQ